MSDRWPFRSTGTSLMTSKSALCAQAAMRQHSLTYTTVSGPTNALAHANNNRFYIASDVFSFICTYLWIGARCPTIKKLFIHNYNLQFGVAEKARCSNTINEFDWSDGLTAQGGDWNFEKCINIRACPKWCDLSEFKALAHTSQLKYSPRWFSVWFITFDCIMSYHSKYLQLQNSVIRESFALNVAAGWRRMQSIFFAAMKVNKGLLAINYDSLMPMELNMVLNGRQSN